ncbi:MAG TPA: aminoacetone oxidase family FAD-binding enzyme [Lachnospiraceae bacterium]|nr:aminoacetone oxidase family FAD-binding enzyme [Lachnospiraceae bacterium]
MNKIIIVGGGASGLMAGITAASKGADVTILEKEKKPGKKLLKTGNGKCNMTNTGESRHAYRGCDPSFAEKILEEYSVQETISFFLHIGIYTLNRDGWVYPYCEQSGAVLEALLMEAKRLGIRIKNNENVTEIRPSGSGFEVLTDTWKYPSDRVILACGTAASLPLKNNYNGFSLALRLGHTMVPALPALVPLVPEKTAVFPWAGVRIRACIRLFTGGIFLMENEGQLQLTEYGISGIPVFGISGTAGHLLLSGAPVRTVIDFFPDFDPASFLSFLEARKEEHPERNMDELLIGLFPDRLIPVLTEGCINLEMLASKIKSFPLDIKSTLDLSHAQCTAGGIRSDEVSSETCESKIVPGLFITGEMLDIDGDCGGWNLQFAWSTGAIAGKAAAEKAKNKNQEAKSVK